MSLRSIVKLAVTGVVVLAAMAGTQTMAQGSDTVLKAADAQKLLPASVYYKGQSAPVQARNSGGVKFADGYYVLASLVDTSGYSTGIAAKYQGYFITETPPQDRQQEPASRHLRFWIHRRQQVHHHRRGRARGVHRGHSQRRRNEAAHALAGACRPRRRIQAVCRAQVRQLQPLNQGNEI